MVRRLLSRAHCVSVVVVLVATGCSGGQKSTGTPTGSGTSIDAATAAPRLDLHCTPQAEFDEAGCAARGEGCAYGPPLICRGIDVDDETKERERRAYESGSGPCQCICKQERMQCLMVP